MPTGLKVVVAVNLLATLFIVTFAAVIGGAVSPADFFAAPSIEIELVPIPHAAVPPVATVEQVAPPAVGVTRIEIPQAFRSTDVSSAPWEVLPDGRIRLNAWK